VSDRRAYASRGRAQETGQAGIEMLVVMLLCVPLILGAFSLAQGFGVRQALAQGTSIAARRIALNPGEANAALASVQGAVDGALLGGTGSVSCDVRDTAGTPVSAGALAFGTPFTVRCSVLFQAQIPFKARAARTLIASQYEVMERYP
jgi:Flp pilus assembly protein TadG